MRLFVAISVIPESAVKERCRYKGVGYAYFHLKNDSKEPAITCDLR